MLSFRTLERLSLDNLSFLEASRTAFVDIESVFTFSSVTFMSIKTERYLDIKSATLAKSSRCCEAMFYSVVLRSYFTLFGSITVSSLSGLKPIWPAFK